jgi:hypothetical protein
MGNMETINRAVVPEPTSISINQSNTGDKKMKIRITQSLGLALCAAALLLVSSTASAVVRQGNPYIPAGADFQIVGLQGIDASNPLGQSGFQTQVNTNFEFTPSIGVTYDSGGGKLTDFGLGLYTANGIVESTGLRTNYNTLVDAASVTITVEDFDLKSGDTGFDLAKKVAPAITLLGANNTIVATFRPGDIFSHMVEQPLAGGKKGDSDIWNINFGDLLSGMHLSDSSITGFILSADNTLGETANSDPYLLLSVGNGIMVPEPANYAVGIAAIVFAGLFHLRQLQLRRKAKI